MNDKIKIVNQYKKKIEILKRHNKLYFINDNPEISDAEYDIIKKEALELEKRFPYLKKLDSLDSIVGAPPSNKFKKIKHLRPMLSLSNAFNKNDMGDFLKKISNFLKNLFNNILDCIKNINNIDLSFYKP